MKFLNEHASDARKKIARDSKQSILKILGFRGYTSISARSDLLGSFSVSLLVRTSRGALSFSGNM